MKCKIILVTGGQRSGKSTYAEKLARENSDSPIYLATSHVWDAEMEARVKKHREYRGPNWTTVEAQLNPADTDIAGRTALLECMTMLCTNMLFDCQEDADKAYEQVQSQIDRLAASMDSTLIIVSNEVGMGGTSPNPLQRKFLDLQGKINQYVASIASEVYFMVSGIPLKIKG